MPEWTIFAVVGVAIVGVVLLIVRFHVNPVIALAIGAASIGLGSGLGATTTVDTMAAGFGETMAEAGLLIAWGVLIGSMLNRLGAVERLVESLLRIFGPKGVPYAIAASFATYLQTIFVDVMIVIAAPLARRIAPHLGKAGVGIMSAVFAVSLETGIALMVPGIGAVMIAGALGIPIGQMMLWGFVAVVPTVLITTLILTILMRAGFWNPEKDELAMIDDESVVVEEARETARSVAGATRAVPVAARQGQHDNPADTTTGVDVDELEPASADRSRELSLFVQFLPLVVSLLLIAAGAVLDVLGIEIAVMQFLGAPAIALLLGVIGTALICRWALPKNELERTLVHGFKDAGQIFALTGVGGALAAIIAATPLGELLTDAFGASSFAPILLVWVIAAILHVAVGSVTLSAMTAAGILAPVAATLGINPVLIGLAAGAGALFLIHVTSNTFWLLQSFLGQSVRGALKSVTFGVSVSSVVALGCVLALSVFI
ncbi:GntP family permease [Gulosibacter faecalis]|jgi:H+/gluconate symporter-like permease|uniref:GntP family permease n=1 Tax=Gulosibacter faecalis TaxID=272240 RepID=A0ABW5UYG9_9MICO|nr:SLC13 family permease [Gulosibacter faecalis]